MKALHIQNTNKFITEYGNYIEHAPGSCLAWKTDVENPYMLAHVINFIRYKFNLPKKQTLKIIVPKIPYGYHFKNIIFLEGNYDIDITALKSEAFDIMHKHINLNPDNTDHDRFNSYIFDIDGLNNTPRDSARLTKIISEIEKFYSENE